MQRHNSTYGSNYVGNSVCPPIPNFCTVTTHLLSQAQEHRRLLRDNGRSRAELHAAWCELVSRVDACIRRCVAVARLPRQEKPDVMQRTWLEILEKLHDFQGEDAVRRLYDCMRKVAHKRAVWQVRRLKKHRTNALDILLQIAENEQEEKRIAEEVEEERELLRLWLSRTRKNGSLDGRLLLGRLVEGKSIGELAEQEGLSENAVSCRLLREARRMRLWLAKRRSDGRTRS